MMFRKFVISGFLLLLNNGSLGQSAQPDSNLWVTNGHVYSVVRDGDQVFIGGSFTHVGPNIPYGTALDISSAEPDQKFAKPNAPVLDAVTDGQGGWFICGQFTAVGDQIRNGIARINPDGSLHPWKTNLSGRVETITIKNDTIYVAGYYTIPLIRINYFVAAVDAATGSKIYWEQTANKHIKVLAASGGRVYLGGLFDSIGGQARSRIAAIDAYTGIPTTWNPGIQGWVGSIAVSGRNVYVGGGFSSIGGQTRTNIAALDTITGAATAWNPIANGGVSCITINGNIVYTGGSFTSIGGQSRSMIAALDASTGMATSWNPDARGSNSSFNYVDGISVSENLVYISGLFSSMGGQPRNNMASVELMTGKVTNWNPPVQAHYKTYSTYVDNYGITAIAPNRTKVYVSGEFCSLGGRPRNNLASLDAKTGMLTDWNPNVRHSLSYHCIVEYIKVNKNTVYITGFFDSVDNKKRRGMAAIDAVTGSITSWDPNPYGSVYALAMYDDKIYAGGLFDSIGGQPRKNLAILNTTDGKATSWNAQANEMVWTLVLNGHTLYVGGEFDSIGGLPRGGIAALDPKTGLPTAWDPKPNFGPGTKPSSITRAIAVNGNTVYAGGYFKYMGTMPRNNLAAIDASTGQTTPWNPDANKWVLTIAATSNTVFVGGWFENIGGLPRDKLAAIDAVTGVATSWNLSPGYRDLTSPVIGSLALYGGKIYISGNFKSIISLSGSRTPRFGIAAFSGVPNIVGTLSESNPMKVYPNPTSGRIRIDYLLPDPDTKLSLELFDGFGRRMLQQENLSISTNLDISFLEKGLYIIVVKDAGGKIVGTERILKL